MTISRAVILDAAVANGWIVTDYGQQETEMNRGSKHVFIVWSVRDTVVSVSTDRKYLNRLTRGKAAWILDELTFVGHPS